MNRTIGVIFASVMLLLANESIASTFQIKGLKLGVSTTDVCESNSETNYQAQGQASGEPEFKFPAIGCKTNIDSLAGVVPSEPANLLFWRGRLIRVVARFERLTLTDAAAFRVAFVDLHGKPSVKRSPSFRTDTWRKGKQRLELEWADDFGKDELPNNFSVSVYLTDEPAWTECQRVLDRASKAEKLQEKSRRSSDVQ